MISVTEEQKQQLAEEGYLIIDGILSEEQLERARKAADRVNDICEETDYPYARADQRLSDRFIEKIEHFLHPDLFQPEIFEAMMKSGILQASKQLLESDELSMTFNRMHVTRRFSAWSNWHRDDVPGENFGAIKATLPLYNEAGFFVIPRSHNKGDTYLDGGTCDTRIKHHVERELRLPVKAGSLLFFDTGILHRGTCAGRTPLSAGPSAFPVCPQGCL